MATDDRPNILLVMTDQHSKHVAGCYGNTVVQTPNIDALAARGVVFDNAYCPYPLCCPSRMSFMTGRSPSELEAWQNAYMLPSSTPTFAHALGAAGYETVLCGRMHFNGPNQRHGFARRIFPEAGGGGAVGQLVGTNQCNRTSIELSGPGNNHYLLYDRQCAAAACEWLTARNSDAPFCMVVGFVGPHSPFVCDQEEFDRYFDAVDVPTYTREHLASRHPYIRRYSASSDVDNTTEHEIRRTRAAYFGMVDIDDQLVGQILAALNASGKGERTVVIYTSDHGELAGEHGLWWKYSFYEGSVSVPLIVSWPGAGASGVRVDTPVTLTDLASTLAEIAGAEPIPGASGMSLVDVVEAGRGHEDRAVFSELFGDMSRMPHGPSGGPSRMMRWGQFKCNYYHDEPPELFNLHDDPGELRDLAGDPAHSAVLDDMLAEILRDWDPERVRDRAWELRVSMDYVRRSPGDETWRQTEYWRGPKDYGSVTPV